jgi:chromosome segregation ATPase
MREIPREMKLEVAKYYVQGFPYSYIEDTTGISHGSIVNIVKELEDGKLSVPGISFDQVNDLRQLSLDLKKKGLEPFQAQLGLLFFQRLQTLGIKPELLEEWAELAKKLLTGGVPAIDFLEAALRLHELEKSEGKSYDTLAEEYAGITEEVKKLQPEVDLLSKNKNDLSEVIEDLSRQFDSQMRTKDKLKNEIEIQTTKLNGLESRIKEAQGEKSLLDKETKDLQRKKSKLSSEIDGKEESLKRLDDIGFSDEDLLRLSNFIEKTSKKEGISNSQIKEKFFSTLSLFGDISGLENRRKAEVKQISKLAKKQSVLNGQIIELENRKALLEGEIQSVISSTSQNVRAIGEDAASQMQQQVTDMKNQLNGLLADVLRAGEAIGVMQQIMKRGEQSENQLASFIKEVQNRVRRN